ncbi:hypothetical protein ACBR55_12035 [Salinicoccus roseus]|uniref:hypothetical protein n=1 Tax=Salinicoccus roseus TaxID=45670 RepID=UPI003523CEED
MDDVQSFVARIYANIRNFERNINRAAAQASKVPDEINTDVDANISRFRRGLLQAEALAKAFERNVVTRRIKADVDRFSFRRAYHAIQKNFTDPFNRRIGELATNIRSIGTVMANVFKGGIFASLTAAIPIIAGLTSAVMALGVALGVVIGGVLALVGAFAVAGAGGLAFGGIVATVLKRYNDEAFQATEASARFTKALDTIKASWNSIVDSHMDTVFQTMGQAIYAANSALNQMIPFIDGVVNSMAGMTNELKAFINESPTMMRFFENMNTTGVRVFENIIRAAGQFGKGLIDMMNAAMPLIDWVAQGFNNLGEQFANWSNRMAAENGFQDFTNYVMENMPKIGRIFGNTFLGIIDLFAAFGANSSHVFDGLDRMTQRFRDWAAELSNNKAFQNFVEYIERTGPVVIDLIGNIIGTLVNLGIAMAPLGEAVLNVANKIFEFTKELLANHPVVGMIIGVITTLAGVLMMAVPAAMAIWTGIQALGTAFGAITLKVLSVISIFATLIGSFIYLWQTNEQFRNRVVSIWNQVKAHISNAISAVSSFIMSIWGALVAWWDANQQNILTIVTSVWNAILTVVEYVMSTLVPVIATAWNFIRNTIATVLGFILNIASTVITAVANFWTNNHNTIVNVAMTIWDLVLNTIVTVVTAIYNIVMTIVNAVTTFWAANHGTIIAVASMIWEAVWGLISTVVGAIWNTVSTIFGKVRAFWSDNSAQIMQITNVVFPAVLAIIGGVLGGIIAVVTAGLHIITGAFEVAWALISNVVQIAVTLILGIIELFINIVTGQWTAAWEGIRSTTEEIFGSIFETVSTVLGAIGDTVGKVFGFIGDTLGLASSDTSAKTSEMANSVSTNTSAMSAKATSNTSGMASGVNANTSAMASNSAFDFESLLASGTTNTAALNTGVTSQTGYMRDHATQDISAMNQTGSADFTSLHSTGASEASGLSSDFTAAINEMANGSTAETANMDALMSGDFESLASTGSSETAGLSSDVLSEFEGMSSGSMSELDSLLSNSNSNFADISSTGTNETANMNKAATQSYRSMQKAGTNSMQMLSQATISGMSQMVSATNSGMSAMVNSIMSGGARAVASIRSTMSQSVGTIRSSYGQFYSAGAYTMGGYRAGLQSQAGSIYATASGIANRAAATIRSALKIKSPSRVTMAMGAYTGQGFAIGIGNESDRVVNEVLKMTDKLQNAYEPEFDPIGFDINEKDLNGSITAIGDAEIRHDLENGLDVKQSANIRFTLGDREYRGFVEDINDETVRVTNLDESYLGGVYE